MDTICVCPCKISQRKKTLVIFLLALTQIYFGYLETHICDYDQEVAAKPGNVR